MQLTANFKLDEFRCRDGSEIPVELLPRLETLAVQLQMLRDRVQAPIVIVSAFRSLEYNRRIGSKDTSQHVQGRAADIRVLGVDVQELAKICEELMDTGRWIQGGIGVYPKDNFVHVDTRGSRSRWSQ